MSDGKYESSNESKTVSIPIEIYNTMLEQTKVISLFDILKSLWKGKLIILFATTIFAVTSIVVAMNISNKYKAEALIQPKASEGPDGLASIASQFGGLASLAGVNLGGENSSVAATLEILKSKRFIIGFIQRHNLQVSIMAAKRWEPNENKLVIDDEIFSQDDMQWVRDVSFPKKKVPSQLELYEEFMELLTVDQDQDTGLIKVGVVFYSPEIAKNWVDWLINDINVHIKEKDKLKALTSINYLDKELANTSISSNKNILFQLMEEQLQKLMLTEITDEYAFEIIDPAFIAEKKHSPQRALIVIGMTIVGFFFGLIILFLSSFYKSNTKEL